MSARKERTTDSARDERSACTDAIDDDLGEGTRWGMTIGISQAGVRTQIALQHLGVSLEARAAGSEPAPTVWNAMCRLEKMLQARRGARSTRGRRSHAELLGAE